MRGIPSRPDSAGQPSPLQGSDQPFPPQPIWKPPTPPERPPGKRRTDRGSRPTRVATIGLLTTGAAPSVSLAGTASLRETAVSLAPPEAPVPPKPQQGSTGSDGLEILLTIGLSGVALASLLLSRPQGRVARAKGDRRDRWLPQSRPRWWANQHERLHDPDYLRKILEVELGSDPASGDNGRGPRRR